MYHPYSNDRNLFVLRILLFFVVLSLPCAMPLSHASASELRVWSTLDGKFSTLAEFESFTDDQKVVLVKPSGKRIKVPINLLSGEDKDFLSKLRRTHNPSDTPRTSLTNLNDPTNSSSKPTGSLPKKDAKPRSAAGIEKEANRASTAEEAVIIYELNLSAGNISASEMALVQERLQHWKSLAAQKMVRLGRQWITKEEAEKAKERAREKVDQAIEYLRLKNGKMAEEALRQASRIDPGSTEAHQVIGLVYGWIDNNDRMATVAYKECLKRDPGNAVILNNLAISEFFSKRYNDALRHWTEAASRSPDTKIISQNLGSALSVVGQKNLRVSNNIAHEAGDIYHRLLTKYDHKRPENVQFWYITPKRFHKQSSYDNGEGDLISVGSGSGFVVAPGIILTNQHVVEDADGLLIIDPEDSTNRLPASVIAEDADIDLAIVRCESLRADPVTITNSVPGRGADIMVLGYPLGPEFGMNIKSTRGSIVAQPSKSEKRLLYDALTNPGNSGGPIVDQQGRVIGVVRAIQGHIGGTYGIAIPIETAVTFLSKHGIDYVLEQSTATEKYAWEDVDKKISPSTVLVMNRQKSSRSSSFDR